MLVYAAYAAVVAHIAFGALLSGKNFGLAIVAAFAVASVTGLHIAAAWRPPASNENPRKPHSRDPLSIPRVERVSYNCRAAGLWRYSGITAQ